MRVLVTGASGFVGSHAVVALVGAGHEVRLLVRNPDKVRRVLAGLGVAVAPDPDGQGPDDVVRQAGSDAPAKDPGAPAKDPGVPARGSGAPARGSGVHVGDPGGVTAGEEVVVVRGDVRDRGGVRRALEGCDAVLHAAAEMGVTGRDADLRGANVVGLENVLGQAKELGLDPVVHVSTIAVFVPPKTPVITVDSALAEPRNAYGRSKVEGERYARDLGGVTIVYPGGVAGPHQPTLDALNEGLRAGLRLAWPLVPGGVSILDVRDLAAALAGCFKRGRGERRYLLGGHFRNWVEVVDLCASVTGRRVAAFRIPGGLLRGLGAALDAVRVIDYPLTKDAADFMLTLVPTDDSQTLKDLDLTLRPVEDTVSDTLRWLVAEGHLKPGRIGRLAT